MRTVTPKNQSRLLKILAYIHEYQKEHHYPPSLRDIGRNTDITSTSVVSYYLDQLHSGKFIERDPHLSRTITITEEGLKAIGVKIERCETCHQVIH